MLIKRSTRRERNVLHAEYDAIPLDMRIVGRRNVVWPVLRNEDEMCVRNPLPVNHHADPLRGRHPAMPPGPQREPVHAINQAQPGPKTFREWLHLQVQGPFVPFPAPRSEMFQLAPSSSFLITASSARTFEIQRATTTRSFTGST